MHLSHSLKVMIAEILFTRASKLIHQKNHTGPKLHKCDACNKAFLFYSIYFLFTPFWKSEGSHERKTLSMWMNTEGPLANWWPWNDIREFINFECKCIDTLDKVSKPTEHWAGSTEPTPNKGGKCEKCFKFYSQSNRHQRTHTGEKPFKWSMWKDL